MDPMLKVLSPELLINIELIVHAQDRHFNLFFCDQLPSIDTC